MPSLRALTLGGLAGFVALVALQHPLRPDLPPAEHFVSEYAIGSTAPLQVAAFASWAVAMAAAAVLAARLGGTRGRRIAGSLSAAGLAAATAGALLAAAFQTQTVAGELPLGEERTTGGRLHDAGSLLILTGLLGAALAGLRLVPGRRYKLTVLALAVALVAIVPVLVALGLDAPGIGQRGFILVGCAWLWRFAVEAAPPPSRDQPRALRPTTRAKAPKSARESAG